MSQNKFAGGFGFNEEDAEVQNIINGAAMDDTEYFAGFAYDDNVRGPGQRQVASLPYFHF